ncbi:SDR family NAD(P)-dependent oxidoreductase [Tropicibacter sp. S64]|uniref:SDR family NAD(P)-dependent oxidoreductase n=1 Tax=Tropicibacter sp. S64 TaxID=3415122 RepID=UPI003C7AB8C5
MSDAVVICALACRYPDAATPRQFWRNLMHGRRSFRPLPATRLPLAAYAPERIGQADSITPVLAGLISDWAFDRARFHVPKGSYEATDLTHWLALDLTAEVLAGIGGAEALGRQNTAVIVANTLTGEFSRAGLTRGRLPFLDEVLGGALDDAGVDGAQAETLRALFAKHLTDRFPAPTEDTLAGGLANTIAGRIANYFDFHGGAYTVDGACSSSLLAVHNAASMLSDGSADTVIAGAVDLSLDPFELVGFSRNGALSATRMRVFDERSDGFWPGEGAAVAVFKRESDALAQGLPVLARLRGWAMSTDGAGGLTRPDADGQRLACERALAKAGVAPEDVAYVEAHGTGTPVGDPTEIRALAALNAGRREPVRIGSVKANIGHTKAAAGFAGLVKLVQGFTAGAIPPHVTAELPSRAFAEVDGIVAPLAQAMPVGEGPLIAGLSSFGFGGINVHAVLEKPAGPRPVLRDAPKGLNAVDPGAELFLFKADDATGLATALTEVLPVLETLSLAEMADMARELARRAQFGLCRLAFVAARPEGLAAKARSALDWLESGAEGKAPEGVHADLSGQGRDICLLFSGQAAPVRAPSPLWLRRFPELQALAQALPARVRPGDADTANAQPAITFANLAGLKVLESLGVTASDAIGHSLGELASLVWAGALTPEDGLRLAALRGAVMAEHGADQGAMLRISAGADDCAALVAGGCSVACLNTPTETVVAGPKAALERVTARAKGIGLEVFPLKTSHAFHSADMVPAQAPFAKVLDDVTIAQPRAYTSTVPVTGDDLRARLVAQLVEPVTFAPAVTGHGADTLFIECGPGSGLARLAEACGREALAIDSQGVSLEPLWEVCAALFTAGQDIDTEALFAGRGTWPGMRTRLPELLSNPCGARSVLRDAASPVAATPVIADTVAETVPEAVVAVAATSAPADTSDALGTVLQAICAETGLPVETLDPAKKFQSDLHMNSLAVVRIATAAARAMGVNFLGSPTDFADGSAQDLADALADLVATGGDTGGGRIHGVRPWFHAYGTVWEAAEMPKPYGEAGQPARLTVPEVFDQPAAERLFADVQEAARKTDRLEVLHRGAPVSAFLRSAFVEGAFTAVTLVDLGAAAEDDPRIDALCKAARAGQFREMRLDAEGGLSRPVFGRVTPEQAPVEAEPRIILAVGCHRGIGTECAFAAAGPGSEVIFVGRSRAKDREIAETLNSAAARGIAARYLQCDVADPAAVKALAETLDVTPDMLLYAPALNVPQTLLDLSAESVAKTLAPKTAGLSNVLDTFGGGLTRLIAFGSIIGRIGLEGECHYALANAMQSALVEDFGRAHPDCAALSLEWTVWSGAGMGERLGIVERLGAMGVDALPFDEALAIYTDMLDRGATGTVCITGRYGARADLIVPQERMPLRFTEDVLIDYPGSECVVETTLGAGRDPYLADHRVMGHEIFPGVMALEAMAQTASGLLGERVPVVRDVAFERAIVVPHAGLRIRVAALAEADGSVSAAVFSEEDGFVSPCLRAVFDTQDDSSDDVPAVMDETGEPLITDAAALYGPVFFHGPSFACVRSVRAVTSRRVVVDVTRGPARWFGGYEAQTLLLGDPAISDAAMHMLQMAVPHRRVLPLTVARISRFGEIGATVRIEGTENWAKDGEYSFDMAGFDADGACTFVWRDARFVALAAIDTKAVLDAAPVLAEALLERKAREALDDTVRVALVHGEGDRRAEALTRLGLDAAQVLRRADGRPMLPGGHLSLSHGAGVTLAILSDFPVACDLTDPGETYPEGMDAASFARAEVRRKLGLPEPFADGRAHDGLTLVPCPLAPLPLTACFGGLPAETVPEERHAHTEAAE